MTAGPGNPPMANGGWRPPETGGTPPPALPPASPPQPAPTAWGGSLPSATAPRWTPSAPGTQPSASAWGGAPSAPQQWSPPQPAQTWAAQVPNRPAPYYPQSSPYPVSPYGANPYPQPYNPYAAYGFAPWAKRPEAPSANTSMVLGIIAIAAGILLFAPIGLLGIAAVVLGNKAKREIKESRGYYDGSGKVTAGLICGWIGAAWGGLSLLLILLLIALAASNG